MLKRELVREPGTREAEDRGMEARLQRSASAQRLGLSDAEGVCRRKANPSRKSGTEWGAAANRSAPDHWYATNHAGTLIVNGLEKGRRSASPTTAWKWRTADRRAGHGIG